MCIRDSCKVLLFGSRAKNLAVQQSDYDIMLIVNEELSIREKLSYKALFRKMTVKHELITDVFIESEAEIKMKSTFYGHIVRTAVKEGIYL
jgi:predicted nucleotidyltransferase